MAPRLRLIVRLSKYRTTLSCAHRPPIVSCFWAISIFNLCFSFFIKKEGHIIDHETSCHWRSICYLVFIYYTWNIVNWFTSSGSKPSWTTRVFLRVSFCWMVLSRRVHLSFGIRISTVESIMIKLTSGLHSFIRSIKFVQNVNIVL